MSRFGQLAPPRQTPAPPVQAAPAVKPLGGRAPVMPPKRELPPPEPNAFQSFCFITLCVYLLSGYANDLALRVVGNKAYLSLITVCMLPILFFLTGTVMRGLQHPLGKLWLGFAICVGLSFPFSIWRSGTLTLLMNYYPKAYILFFYIAACIISVRQLRSMMNVMVVGAFIVPAACFAFGSSADGRLSIPGSIFFSNANELGLQLLLNSVFLLYAVMAKKNFLIRVMSFGGIGLSAYYMFKTGSRGEFLAFMIVGATTFLFSRRKLVFVAVGVPAICISLFLLPAETRHRLTYIVMSEDTVASNVVDQSNLDSQKQREYLLQESIAYSFQYPLFGVGAGQFAVRVAGDKEKKGIHAEWMGTHNTYTQVSSETGLPAFICYTLALIACIRMNYSVFKKTADNPAFREYYAIAFCMFLCAIAYAVSTCFFHIAYSNYFPLIGGISLVNYLIAKPAIEGTRGREPVLPPGRRRIQIPQPV